MCGVHFKLHYREIITQLFACRSVIDAISDDTVLFVFGDHGMTMSGDHGGDSHDELNAALFVYSPKSITESQPPPKVCITTLWGD